MLKNISTKRITREFVNGKIVDELFSKKLDERVRLGSLVMTRDEADHKREYRFKNGVLFCEMERFF